MTNLTLNKDEIKFEQLKILLEIIKNESFFMIQLFTLESIDIFEEFLKFYEISYVKQLTSNFEIVDDLVLLIGDSKLPDNFFGPKVIFFSNDRDHKFIPYKFGFSQEEKKKIFKNPHQYQIYKNYSVSSVMRNRIDFHKYTSESLNYLQSLIIFCMIREKSFSRICKELQNVDSSINNKFKIKCELNNLVNFKVCKRSGHSYLLNISKETIQKICDKIDFSKALQH